jgi:SPX domain protein involved in polyphosphate accumulation/uncharacterized membrane protein YidH (DUF202 family)
MKFGEYLHAQKAPEWQNYYIDYDQLKLLIKELEETLLAAAPINQRTASLSVPLPTNAAGMPVEQMSQENFYAFLEQEMRKIEQFTKKQVDQIRRNLSEAERKINLALAGLTAKSEAELEALKSQVEQAGEDFLKLEKYVNLNFMGFHKILKKHDKHLPNPCRTFYTARLHEQSWVRGDYSDVLVTMSRVYSKLRGDQEIEEQENAKQDFVRSTRKYWVHTEHISAVKYSVLQHLPVFLQKTMAGETDSQLINSVYLDNHAMELYHGRLEKSPGAIALRFRWYGTGTPETVFVERKTHRESWAGEVSVKERFIINEKQVPSLLTGGFDVEGEVKKLRAKKKSEDDVKEWLDLTTEVIQAINSKQLVPTMRTQYMRTAFQIPFDATVRVSLDTNLCMISERTKDTLSGQRWYRDPSQAVPLTEITRFPHAVLEIKLQLEDESKTPQWVSDLINSGMLLEVHKFSKFIHGCAVLMPDDVRAVPYWIDDATLADSIGQSGASSLLAESTGANQYYNHLLPHDSTGEIKQKPKPRVQPESLNAIEDAHEAVRGSTEWANFCGADGILDCNASCDDFLEQYCEFADSATSDRITVQKVEPKLFFANERTFLSWLQMGVLMSSIAIGILAFSARHSQSQAIAVLIMPISLLFVIYALRTFLVRNEKIKTRDANRWDDPYGPVILTVFLILTLLVQFSLKVAAMYKSSGGSAN